MMRLVLALVACCGAVKLDSKLSVTEMGSAQLLEMKNDLKHRLDMHELAKPGEKAVFKYFKQLILNTSIPRLTYSAVHDQDTIARHWNAVLQCRQTLTALRDGSWSDEKTVWTEDKFAHEECRTYQAQPDTICEDCRAYTLNLSTHRPQDHFPSNPTPVYHTTQTVMDFIDAGFHASYGDDRKGVALSGWFNAYYEFHCVEGECPTGGQSVPKDCTHSCIQACLEYENNLQNRVENCTTLQDKFEHQTCTWSQAIAHDCNVFNNCKTSKDNQYNVTVDRTHGNHKRREVEYQIMKTIVCFIDLLVGDQPLTDTAKNGCQVTYPMEFLALNWPHTNFQDEPSDVYTELTQDCRCTDLNVNVDGDCESGSVHPSFYSDPIPCNGFSAFYYNQSWSVLAPADECGPCIVANQSF